MRFRLNIDRKNAHVILGISLRYARMKEGLSLRDLGDLANISHTLIANIEHGKTVANNETLRLLFQLLHIEFRDDQALIDMFQERFERILYHLFTMRYDEVQDDMAFLMKDQTMYENSIVTVEFTLLHLIYGVLTDSITKEQTYNIDILQRITALLNPLHTQLRYLIVGIHLHNQGRYHDSINQLEQAQSVGEKWIDSLVSLYILKNQVRMFIFMDAQRLAEQTILLFETQLNYQRAMEVRVELARSHMLLRKYDEVNKYLQVVEQFTTDYGFQNLVNECNKLRISIELIEGRYETAKKLVDNRVEDSFVTIVAQIMIAAYSGQFSEIQAIYQLFMNELHVPHRKRELVFLDVLMMIINRSNVEDEVFVEKVLEMVDIGITGRDMELLMYGYELLIEHYKERRMYKKALEYSITQKEIRSYGKFNIM